MIIELVLIVAAVIVAGRYAGPLVKGLYGVMFWGGTVVLGILLPFGLNRYAGRPGTNDSGLILLSSILVLLGGALLRICLVQAGQI